MWSIRTSAAPSPAAARSARPSSPAPVPVLDDLAPRSPTPWAQEKLFQLINHRYNERLPTVVTTNIAPEQLDERLRTRLPDASLARVYVLESKRPSDMRALDVLDH